VGRSSYTTSISHFRPAGQDILRVLDSEMYSGGDPLETTREYLQHLLNGEELTELYAIYGFIYLMFLAYL
jgi:cohesin loading factor subunit SCC2